MSINITIGDLVVEIEKYTEHMTVYDFVVKKYKREDMEVFPGDEYTGNSNHRSTSNAIFYNFCVEAEITHLFFYKNGNYIQYPTAYQVTIELLGYFEEALQKRIEVSSLEPGFGEDRYDSVKARLIWFIEWIKWALDNCSAPALSLR